MKDAEPTADENVLRMTVNCLDRILERLFQLNRNVGLTQAPTKEEFYGFGSADVAMIHYHKLGLPSRRVFFRLHDGRVFDGD